MKFKGTISKIDEQGVKAKTDNSIGERPSIYGDFGDEFEYCAAMMKCKEAEANRREYDIATPSQWFCLACNRYLESHEVTYEEECETCKNLADTLLEVIQIGDRIEGEIINNEIVNVKIIS